MPAPVARRKGRDCLLVFGQDPEGLGEHDVVGFVGQRQLSQVIIDP